MCCQAHAFKDSLACCKDDIKLPGVAAATTYQVVVTDSHGNKHIIADLVSDADGILTIMASALPDSLFSVETNKIKIEVKSDLNDCDNVPLKITGSYQSVELDFKGTKDTVGCSN